MKILERLPKNQPASDVNDNPTLSELLRHTRDEIQAAVESQMKAGTAPMLRVETATVEMNVVITRSREGEAGLDIKVVSIGGTKSYQREEVHKITVELKPLLDESALARISKGIAGPVVRVGPLAQVQSDTP